MKSASCKLHLVDEELCKACCFRRWQGLVGILARLGIPDAYRQYFGTANGYGGSTPEGYVRVHLPGGKYSPRSAYAPRSPK